MTNWVAVSMHEEADVVKDLARLTHDKTLGNPFFVRQFLRDLVTDDLLRVDASGTWSWDVTAVDRRSVSENVGDLVSRQVARLPSGVREILQAASCVGPEFDLDSVVSIVGGDRDEAVAGLHAALRSGLVLPRDDAYQYASGGRSRHQPSVRVPPRPRAGGRSRVDAARRCAPRATWRSPGAAWRRGIPIRPASMSSRSTSPATSAPRSTSSMIRRSARVAARWLVAGAVRAKAVMATEPAQVFLDHADTLLPADRWNTYADLARRLHTEAADIAYIEGRFADIDRHAVPVLAHTSDPLERMPIHNIHIGIGVAQNRWGEATQYAIDVLADEYGIELPYKPSLVTVATEIAKMRWQLRRWTIDDLRDLPPMHDELVDASMSLLMKTATNAYWASPNLVPLIGLTMVRESIRHGNSGLSAYGYVLYGLVASAVLFEAELGYRYGELAMEVLDRSGARHLVGKTALVHHGFIRHGVEPMATCGKSVLEGFHEAHAAGDIENAAYCAMAALYTAVVSGEPLPALTERLAPYVDAVRASGHEQTIYGTSVWLQAVDNLVANSVEPELRGAHIDFEPRLAELLVSEGGNAIPQGVCAAGFLAFLLDDDERAERAPRAAVRQHAQHARAGVPDAVPRHVRDRAHPQAGGRAGEQQAIASGSSRSPACWSAGRRRTPVTIGRSSTSSPPSAPPAPAGSTPPPASSTPPARRQRAGSPTSRGWRSSARQRCTSPAATRRAPATSSAGRSPCGSGTAPRRDCGSSDTTRRRTRKPTRRSTSTR